MATIAIWLIQRGVSSKLAKPLAWAMVILAAIIIAILGWLLLKNAIIRDHEQEQRAERAEQTIERRIEADTSDREQEERDRTNREELKEEARHAANKDPAGAGTAVGPVTRAVTDRLREQRSREARD